MPLPRDHLERVYAGVLGKVIGVYLGRPFEGLPRETILSKLGYVRYYVNHKIESPLFKSGAKPLVVTDDDVTCTFVMARALEEHDAKQDLSAEGIGKTWLNQTVANKSIFWWGGRGISTEHTAYLNLKAGIPAPRSGSIEQNGKIVAEQIGGEIFIDGFALCCPGNPDLAAKLAKEAASVSHDGEAVYGAMLWAAMEAEAFLTKDISHLIDTGLRYIPKDSGIAKSTADIREWAKIDKDWEKTLSRIQERYGMHIYKGACHVVPNHAIKIMSLLYGGHSYDEGIHIIVTCGWDTDSNGGNMGALLGIMHGLKGFETGPDWRGPLADRAVNSSADGGYSINNCTRMAYDLFNFGRQLAGEAALPPPKDGAQFHFSLPGSVQGFMQQNDERPHGPVKIEQAEGPNGTSLALRLAGLSVANDPVEVMTDTFMSEEQIPIAAHYTMQASPLVYPGQKVQAVVFAEGTGDAVVNVTLRLKYYDENNALVPIDGPSVALKAGDKQTLKWTLPATNSNPIAKLGLSLSTPSPTRLTGTLHLTSLCWRGAPNTTFATPKGSPSTWPPPTEAVAWRRAWIDNVTTFPHYFPNFHISQSYGEGGIFTGCRDWDDYRLTVEGLVSNNQGPCGPVVRYRGLRRWYGLMFLPGGRVAVVKARDEERVRLAEREWKWSIGEEMECGIVVEGSKLRGFVSGECVLEAEDGEYTGGGIGMIVTEGSAIVREFRVEPLEDGEGMRSHL